MNLAYPLRTLPRLSRALGTILLVSLFPSCAMVGHNSADTMRQVLVDVTRAPDRTYAATTDEIQDAARSALTESGIEIVDEGVDGQDDWYVVGEIGYSWRSNGQFLRITVRSQEAEDEPRTGAYYDAVRRFDINVTEDLSVVRGKVLAAMDSFVELL